MAAYYKTRKTLVDVLEDLYKEYGYYKEKGISLFQKEWKDNKELKE